jgi:hypothetical protein
VKLWVVQKLLEISLPPFCFIVIQVPIDPMALFQNAKHLGFRDSTTSLVALLYLSLCSNANTHVKKKMLCSNACKQALIVENEKSESSRVNEASNHKKLCQRAQTRGPNSFDLEFWSKIEFGILFDPFVFFVPNFEFHPLFQPN